jgi:hypothetical protein
MTASKAGYILYFGKLTKRKLKGLIRQIIKYYKSVEKKPVSITIERDRCRSPYRKNGTLPPTLGHRQRYCYDKKADKSEGGYLMSGIDFDRFGREFEKAMKKEKKNERTKLI